MYLRFTPQARAIVTNAKDVARALGHGAIDDVHFLQALTDVSTRSATLHLTLGRCRDVVRTELAPLLVADPSPSRLPLQPFTETARRFLARAGHEARRLHDTELGPEHLLLALLAGNGTRTSSILQGAAGLAFECVDALCRALRQPRDQS